MKKKLPASQYQTTNIKIYETIIQWSSQKNWYIFKYLKQLINEVPRKTGVYLKALKQRDQNFFCQ